MRYKLLGSSGLRVSELCLGTMTFGEDWGWGASKEVSRTIFDSFVEAGGNLIDTANNYTDGTSEQYVGEFIADERERFVLATKFTLSTRKDDPNGGGNHRKNMVQAVEASLRRLNTEYIDLYWLHMWDGMTPIDEVMRALDDLVRAGKVLYVGVSDTPAWVISRANMLAELRGWSRFVALQIPYNLARRDPERELLPMAKALDLAVTPWGLLGGGVLTGKYTNGSEEPRRYEKAGEQYLSPAEVVGEVAQELGQSPSQVAINWVRQQQNQALILPILGARTEEQIEDNLGCLAFELEPEHLERLGTAAAFDPGFPQTFLNSDHVRNLIFGETYAQLDSHRS